MQVAATKHPAEFAAFRKEALQKRREHLEEKRGETIETLTEIVQRLKTTQLLSGKYSTAALTESICML